MKKLYICVGVPASGKSTWAEAELRKDSKNIKRVNMDSLRFMATDYKYTKENEQFIFNLRSYAIRDALKRGFDVISDDTNLLGKTRKTLHKIAKEVGDVMVIEKYFDISLAEALHRDANRGKQVGEAVVKRFYKKYINRNLKIKEFTYYLPTKIENTFRLMQDELLPKAIMADVDGTLAKMVSRGPFEWNKVKEDVVNEPVAEIVRKFHSDGYEILVMTAREGQCEDDTREWLSENNIPFNKLFIKPPHDNRKDVINKREIFDKYIRGRYNVMFVLDDRLSVCRLWHELGLSLLRVGDPDADF